MAYHTTTTLIADNAIEDNFRNWAGAVGAAAVACSLTKLSNPGQPVWDSSIVRATSQDTAGSFPVTNVFDAGTGTAWRSSALPTVGSPIYLIYDAGNGNTFDLNGGNTKIYTASNANDPKNITLEYSDNGTSWTAVTISLTTLALSTGYQTSNITAGGGVHRYWRLGMTDVQSGTGYVQVLEWQLFTSGAVQATTTTLRPTASNTASQFEIYALADTLHGSTAPCFIKIEYGSSFSTGIPSIWITMSNGHDGYGTLNGTYITSRQQIASSTSNVTAPRKCAFSGDINRFQAELFYDIASGNISICIERSHDGAEADTGEAVILYSQNGSGTHANMPLTYSLPQPTVEAAAGAIFPVNALTTSLFNSETVLYKTIAFTPKPLLPASGVWAYYSADLSTETPFSATNSYGNTHTYLPIGNIPASTARGNTNSRRAILWD